MQMSLLLGPGASPGWCFQWWGHGPGACSIVIRVSTPECIAVLSERGCQDADVSAAWSDCYSRVAPPAVRPGPRRLHHIHPNQHP